MPPSILLDVPEIMSLIASYLNGKDLSKCVCVSKNWYGIFLPHRWRVIHSQFQDTGYILSSYGPKDEAIFKHRHLIQELLLVGELDPLETYHYPNTRHLLIDLYYAKSTSRLLKVDIAGLHPSLVSLEFNSVDVPPSFWTAMLSHPHIKIMRWKCKYLTIHDGSAFWDVCRKLESLTLDGVAIYNKGAIPNDIIFDGLRSLAILRISGLNRAEQMHLFLQSPNLESLEWGYADFRSSADLSVIRPVPRNHWPRVNKFHIDCNLKIADYVSIFEGIGDGLGNIVDLRLGHQQWGEQTYQAIALHYGNLVKVDLSSSYHTSSPVILDFLCFCPRLEFLSARAVYAKDIVERGPWICLQLRVLTTLILVGEEDRDLQPAVFERLSTLVQLKELMMLGGSSMEPFNGSLLEFRLDQGMGQLASLQNLAKLTFRVPYFQLEIQEVEWMMETWKNLKCITGDLHSDREANAELVRVIKSRGLNKKP
ncbi:hypothetical protein BGX34_005002 [Mortierella sp. NVP85]|nr:hypothetical protein BGX34_005002 [Mortierella sp. NVP85]